ncbi:hypothetical protein ASG42_10880 [Rhizobium sp. Leaf391]|uniref:hypothetical protein n=1 Tax=Rhizobium sp. Leaf391 TaxID=1736360 RepID=UPI000712B086|nr:hypothetical protein [Rhizobium sp. Leaf391]KQS90993.1 hypothetical protein ASG42_10880 [Rhizobium sp. Leaf391]
MSDNKPATITGLVDHRKLRSAESKSNLRLKYLPVDFDFDRVDEYQRYLAMSPDDQKAYVAEMSNLEAEFWISLETSRALYVDPLDKRDGPITEAKVARYPEKYR